MGSQFTNTTQRTKVVLVLPTLNATINNAQGFLNTLSSQSFQDFHFLVIDSSSDDSTQQIFLNYGAEVRVIPRSSFDHAKVRNIGHSFFNADLFIFITQDIYFADQDSLLTLIRTFEEPSLGAAFGRQVPHLTARPIETHARLFNYPSISLVKSQADIPLMGIKAAFISNSFAAYRRSALEAIGGFPERCIVSEDTYVAAKMLLAGWKIAYCAEAQVYHSHGYNLEQEFKRYFDIGVFHAREPWVREKFGGAEGEGLRFLKSEVKYLLRHNPYLILSALVRTLIKYLGFRTGLLEKYLPVWIKKKLSMQKAFWDREKAIRGEYAQGAG